MNVGMYRHYKGGMYLLLGIGEHTETKEIVAVYVSMNADLPGPRIRVRPLHMFIDYVGKEPRFEYVGNGL
jgi:hypothetical protein